MKTVLTIAAASALFGIAGYAAAEPTNQDHASHNHAAPVARPTPTQTSTPDAKGCGHAMPGGAPMGGGMSAMPGMAGKDGAPMDHQHMMGGDMKGCEHMMHGGTMPMTPAPSPAPSASPKP